METFQFRPTVTGRAAVAAAGVRRRNSRNEHGGGRCLYQAEQAKYSRLIKTLDIQPD